VVSALIRLLDPVLGLFCIYRTDAGVVFRWEPAKLVTSITVGVTVTLMAFLLLLFTISLVRFAYYSPLALVEEAAYTYTTSTNFLRFGYTNSAFLQDFSNASDPADHPFVYNHMPPGPDILTAVFLQISGGSFRFARLAYAVIYLAGLIVYASFAAMILRRFGVRGAALAVILLGPWALMQNLDRQPYSPFPLLAFAPLLLLQASYRTGRRWLAVASLALVYLSSLYMEYNLLAAVLWCWIMLWATQVLPLQFRHLVWFIVMVSAGVVTHLIQNAIYLGWDLFVLELMITLSNRATGNPSAEEVKAFFQSIGIANHGSRKPDLAVIVSQLFQQFHASSTRYLGLALGLGLVWLLIGAVRVDTRQRALLVQHGDGPSMVARFARLWLWIGVTCIMPNLMFPAFNQEVTLYGSRANLYFLNIGVVAVFGFLVVKSWSTIVGFFSRDWVALVRPFGGDIRSGAGWWGHLRRLPVWVASQRMVREATHLTMALWLVVALWIVLLVAILLVGLWSAYAGSLTRGLMLIMAVAGAQIVALAAFSVGYWSGQPARTEPDRTPEGASPDTATAITARTTRAHDQMPVSAPTAAFAGTTSPGRTGLGQLGGLVCAGLALLLVWLTASNVWASTNSELTQVRNEHRQLRYRHLTDIEQFAGQLFMTNINIPTVGFFVKEAGFGVCGLDSLLEDGNVDPARCKVSFMRRLDYWRAQQPQYFFFFFTPDLFPGFADCLPSTTLISQARLGDTCVSMMRDRLSSQYTLVLANPIFEVYNLTEPLPRVGRSDLERPQGLRAVSGAADGILVTWQDGEGEAQYRIERREQSESEWRRIATVDRDGTSVRSTDVKPNTVYLFRVRACTDRGCSPIAQTGAKTP
jgi:hypothetical protein